jgi:hypothetical protein
VWTWIVNIASDLWIWIGSNIVALAFVALVLLIIVLLGGYIFKWKWTGLVKDDNYPRRTFWDWLDLLIVPAVLALGGLWFAAQQDARQEAIQDQRAQEAALQAYLDQMSALLLDRSLLSSDPDSEPRMLARARTLTILTQLETSAQKRTVLKFLYEAYLIQGDAYFNENNPYFDAQEPHPEEGVKNAPIISLKDVKLDRTNLIGSHLLLGADLEFARLHDAKMARAVLTNAYLHRARLTNADLTDAALEGVNFTDADLKRADFTGADLDGADFTDAKGVTAQQLHQEAKSLEDATMPNGQKYEDWLKSKGGGEDEENSGPS